MSDFTIIKPITITDAMLTSSTVAETDYDDWVTGTTYGIDEYVQVTTSGVHKVYKSAVGSNTGHSPPDNIYDDTTDPDTPTGYWIEVSATNKWKMFDGRSRAATVDTDEIIVEVTPGAFFNALGLTNIDAESIRVIVTDPSDGVVYDETVQTADNLEIIDFYTWLFYPIVKKANFVFLDLPAYSTATIKIYITNWDDTVQLGEATIGVSKYIGALLWGYSNGLADDSSKGTGEDGSATLETGTYSDEASFSLRVDREKAYNIKNFLAAHRGTGLVYIGDEDQQETILFGWHNDVNMSAQTLKHSYITLSVTELS